MSAALINTPGHRPARWSVSRRITIARAGLALVWAAALVVAVRNKVPTTDTALPALAAFVLASYPLIDVIASLMGASLMGASLGDRRALRFNAAVSALAVVAISTAAFGRMRARPSLRSGRGLQSRERSS